MKLWSKILACALLLVSSSSFAISFTEAQQIYQNIKVKNGLYNAPILRLANDASINGEHTFWGVYINSGTLTKCTDQEIAIILGHELAHWRRGHLGSNYKNEFEADYYGTMFARNAGYSICAGIHVMRKLVQRKSSTHPHPSERYLVLHNKFCK